ncbi:MAG: acyl-CoA thioesterase [Burkholderiales bacterium]|nr:acyl-CoA thioesterase [Burkholderiales bacterium]
MTADTQHAGRLIHVERMRMRWGDMDVLGHMNNTIYFRYFEQVRISWFDSIGVDYGKLREGPVIGSISCRFIVPAVYPAELEVTLVAGAPRRSAFPLYSELRDAQQPEKVYARAEQMMVWIDLGDGKSRPLPDWMRMQLA